MLLRDVIRFTAQSVLAQRMRSALTALGLGIGVTAVVLLTSIGAGINLYIVEQFTQFGTNTIAVQPGKASTFGISAGVLNSVRPLSLQDAEALKRAPYVLHSVPAVSGAASVKARGRERTVNVFAVGPQFDQAFKFHVSRGSFLPNDDLERPRAVAVLGARVYSELYGSANPLNDRIRIGGDRYRVVGVMEPKGDMLGIDLDDTVYIPAASGLALFNREGLHEIDILYDERAPVDEVIAGIKRILLARHGGEDFTIIDQQQMLDVLGSIIGVLTFGIAVLGGISLLVGGVGIFTIMTIAVRERTPEIGLLRAIGAKRRRILQLFLGEAVLLAGLGGIAGLLVGLGIVAVVNLTIPAMPAQIAPVYVVLAETIAVIIGLIAGVLPAHRAAALEPLEALRTE
ncbi:MAG: ABC transporter permease [Gammaproteobacteria bacterium]|nr:ABC transporter permease [Gammaproteobacteria bacterium]MCZ6498808.1 ABC transporter permease [Gammaproteobacteria bacterium]MCZ6584654.1 ABC transporter permease [Gammaproteobacteria bacterium]TDJ29428.1 MAG: FtsX-like permease family protein [Gammaproteobacteria bacterium]